ncbi:hypothetical protein LEP1GSC018_2522 [Leptospira kirschneri str. 2008720114]|uniref:Uncharacterized protein n=1 Tax=Leptospira kirschneri str. H1 TaxID=1049966 RepID=A0A0E2B4D7_9LEPT|nr:hypothetical protein LEP1GSC081_3461 [Leptospira kirschneri str. H1]EKP04620.1 hypothetical protein LEP1GSC018_2522 [Leptospira kirschneri str. 2008720114]
MFPVCNLLTRAKEPGPAKPDSPRFSYVELTLIRIFLEILKK